MEVEQNLSLVRGDSANITVTIDDHDEDSLMNLESATFEWSICLIPSGVKLLTKTVENGGVQVIDPNGVALIKLQAGDTSTFRQGLYEHKLRIVDGLGQATTVLKGKLTLE